MRQSFHFTSLLSSYRSLEYGAPLLAAVSAQGAPQNRSSLYQTSFQAANKDILR